MLDYYYCCGDDIMTRFCDKCGNKLRNENAKFCEKCGAKVSSNKNKSNVATTNGSALMICPNCGQETPMGQAICVKCGSSLETNTAAIIVGYTVTLLIGIFGLIPGIYLLTRNNEKSKMHGINICVFTIIIFFSGLIFGSLTLSLLLYLIFIVIGLVLWFTKWIPFLFK